MGFFYLQKTVTFLFVFVAAFCLHVWFGLMAAPGEQGSSQAGVTLHSNPRAETHLRPVQQLAAAPLTP